MNPSSPDTPMSSFLYCDVCWVELNSSLTMQAHLASKQHLQNSAFRANLTSGQLRVNFYCETCCITTDTRDILINHSASPRHHSKLAAKQRILRSAAVAVQQQPATGKLFTDCKRLKKSFTTFSFHDSDLLSVQSSQPTVE
jgi:hypothetical protein